MDYYTPTAIANEALDAAGVKFFLGDIREGSDPAQVILRKYTGCLFQLLRGAHWDFARKEAELLLVADATGMANPPLPTVVGAGFMYAYAYPTDCLKIRFVPANYWNLVPPAPPGNIVPPDPQAPLTSSPMVAPFVGQPLLPSRFLITSSQSTIEEGASNNIRGSSPIGRSVILSNVQQARGVYTYQASYPNLWDDLFRAALVAYLASEIVFVLDENRRNGAAIRRDQQQIAQMKIQEARRSNGNESWANADISVDWMVARSRGFGGGAYWGNNWGAGPGYLYGGWDGISFTGNTGAF